MRVAQTVENLPAMQETEVQTLGWEDPLEKGKATHSTILAWRIPQPEESGRLQSTGLQRAGHDWVTNTYLCQDQCLEHGKTQYLWCFLIIAVSVCVVVTQMFLTLCDPVDCSLPDSSVHGILQAGILEWVAVLSSFSRVSSWPRDRTRVSCIAGSFFTTASPGKHNYWYGFF